MTDARPAIDTDVVVIGAGPAGLFALFQLGLLGLRAHLIDALPEVGGQCAALYADKPIYDVPGLPACTGQSLSEQLLAQAEPFMQRDARGRILNLHLGQVVSALADQTASLAEASSAPGGDARFHVRTSQGLTLRCGAVVVAAGAGAFLPRSLPIEGLDGATNVHFDLAALDRACTLDGDLAGVSAGCANQTVVVVGGGEEALDTVIALALRPLSLRPAKLVLLHRRDQWQAPPDTLAQFTQLRSQGRVEVVLGVPQAGSPITTPSATAPHAFPLAGLDVLDQAGHTLNVPLDHLLIRLGLSPKLGALVGWGLALERKQVSVRTDTFESSLSGVYAVGDINTYPGKKRLLVCGFHEATLAAHAIGARLRPDAPQHLQYTTTSTLLLQRLGRLPPA